MPRAFIQSIWDKRLRNAASMPDLDLLRALLAEGADANGASPKRKRTPLMKAVRAVFPDAEAVRVLLEGGAAPWARDESGATALDYARRRLAKRGDRPDPPQRRSSALDEDGNLCLPEQEEIGMRQMLAGEDFAEEFERMYREERLKAAQRRFRPRAELTKMIALLERAMADR